MNYVDTIRPKEAFNSAIQAFLSTVDPYTEYYDSDSRAEPDEDDQFTNMIMQVSVAS